MRFFTSRSFAIRPLLFFAVCPALSAADVQPGGPATFDPHKIDFDLEVMPILQTSCLRCHGPEKPRSRFHLDTREGALKGGNENTNDIVPGDSTNSFLIHYVAREVQDMEMPPVDKGQPLTPQQIAVLRAWIDQGANWSTTNSPPELTFTFAPTLRGMDVSGNQSKFRELEGSTPGFSGGAQQFSFTQQTSPDVKVSVSGQAIVPNHDIAVNLAVDKTDFGFVHAGFEQWRKYYGDIGGSDFLNTPAQFGLGRDLYLDNGRAWVDFGLTLPHRPQIVLGYEYQFKNGSKSMLGWGIANGKNIYPASKAVNERTHIVKLDVTDEFDDWYVANRARLEIYLENNTDMESQINGAGPLPDTFITTPDNYHSTQGTDTLTLEKQIREWWFLSGGFYFSKLEASDFFNQTTASTTIPAGLLNSQRITLGEQSEVFSVASLFTPLSYLTLSLGSQNEWTAEHGFGHSIPDLDLGVDSPGGNTPAGSDSQLFKSSQNVSVRFTELPFTVLYADGRFDQETVSQFQQQDSADPTLVTETRTEASNYRYNVQGGFNTSPWRSSSLNVQYRHEASDTDYNFPIDVVDADPSLGNGYPGFILNRRIHTDQFETKLDLHPAKWLKTTWTYQLANTDYDSNTDPAFRPFSTQVLSPGGAIMDGTSRTRTYGLAFTVTPIRQLYLSSAFTYSQSRVVTAGNIASVVPYDGDVYTLTTTASYAINPKTTMQASYAFSRANYGQDNAVAGVPLGIDFTRNDVIAGLTRTITKRWTAALQYEFSEYSEPTSGNANNFTAHGIFATFIYKWQ